MLEEEEFLLVIQRESQQYIYSKPISIEICNRRAPETFYVSSGVYNWSADPQGVFFLKKAAEYKVPLITAFVNSAPPAFTSNNRSCGGQIVDEQIPNYTKYLADVIAHWKEEGVVFTHVSPMNEPDNVVN